MRKLITPHGGKLKDLMLNPQQVLDEKTQARNYNSWDLTPRQLCDLELLMNGGFSPLEGFLNQQDYDAVVDTMRLKNGTLWPVPITLDVSQTFADNIKIGEHIALRDPEGVLIATMEITDKWMPDKQREAEKIYGTNDLAHPAVSYLQQQAGNTYLGGKINGIETPAHYDFGPLRDSPKDLREKFQKRGWEKIIAFQTRNPMHRGHQELTVRAAKLIEANLLLHPVVGMTKPGDIDHYARVRCYQHILKHYPVQTTLLSLLPLAMRMAGPREALWHGIIHQNYGCTHFIIGCDHAGPGKNSQGKDFYGPYDAQQLIKQFQEELKICMIPFEAMVYVENRAEYCLASEMQENETVLDISGTEFRRRLQEDLDIPAWFSYPEIVEELRKTHPPKHKQGFTVFFTGLSGAGKSTIANALMVKLLELGDRAVTLLDGDIVRKHLSSELGFTKAHRNLNIERIGFVASEITKNGGIAICAPIAPYKVTRQKVREMISACGGFIEVHIATPIETCEQRDRKGLYAKARAGLIKEFTGVSDPYEAPEKPELMINTVDCSPEEAAQRVILKLEKLGYIK